MKENEKNKMMKEAMLEYYNCVMEVIDDDEIFYNENGLKELFEIDKTFKNIDDFFWGMINECVLPEDCEKLDLFRQEDINKRNKNGIKNTTTEFRIKNKEKGYIWVSMISIILYEGTYALFLFKNIDNDKRNEIKNELLARKDQMTGLFNKSYTESLISQQIAKNKEKQSVMIIVDIDNFKQVNDSLGHLSGDEVIYEVAQKLLNGYREKGIVGRIGGDEFIIYIEYITDKKEFEKAIKIFRDNLSFVYKDNGKSININCSMGIAFYDENEDFISMFKKADYALYEAKDKGKNRCSVY